MIGTYNIRLEYNNSKYYEGTCSTSFNINGLIAYVGTIGGESFNGSTRVEEDGTITIYTRSARLVFEVLKDGSLRGLARLRNNAGYSVGPIAGRVTLTPRN